MRISDWSSVCSSSDLKDNVHLEDVASQRQARLSRAAGLGILERSARRRACGPHLEQVAVSARIDDAVQRATGFRELQGCGSARNIAAIHAGPLVRVCC